MHFWLTTNKNGKTDVLWNIDHYTIESMLMIYLFVLFESSDHLTQFQKYLNSCDINMSFIIETVQNNKLSLLVVNVICDRGKFMTNVRRKPTISSVYTDVVKVASL